jgi:uncharacterized protein (DUF1501 family)
VVSEFGRTLRENGNKGTGHASVYWILGGSINGGRVAGEQTCLERANLFRTVIEIPSAQAPLASAMGLALSVR